MTNEAFTLRVANWNIHWRNDDHQRREALLIEELRRHHPDVICLQEAWAGATGNQAERIAEALGLPEVAYLPVRHQGTYSQGQAVISRFPITEATSVEIPDEFMHRRGVTVLLDTTAGRLPVTSAGIWGNAKIAWGQPVIRNRIAPYRTLIDHLAAIPSNLPPLVGLDLNADPHSHEVRWLSGLDIHGEDKTRPDLYLLDTWDPAVDGATIDSSTNPLVTLAQGRWRSDYLLAGHAPRERYDRKWVVDRVGRLGHQLPQPASDHYGVWADLTAHASTPLPGLEWANATEPPKVRHNLANASLEA